MLIFYFIHVLLAGMNRIYLNIKRLDYLQIVSKERDYDREETLWILLLKRV